MRPCDLSTNILGQLDADDLNRIDRKTREVVRGVEETGLQGTITLKITFKKNGENSTIYEVKDNYKVPEKAAGTGSPSSSPLRRMGGAAAYPRR